MSDSNRVPVLSRFLAEIRRESDRGLALVGCAFIDEQLADALHAFFCKDGRDLLVGKNAPLGTFSARIEICHALGLIEDIERNDCDCIRRIRNEFAHKVLTASFMTQKVSDLCSNLQSELPEPNVISAAPPRLKFENAIVTMATRLLYRDLYVAQEKRQPKRWIDPAQLRWRRTAEEKPPPDALVLGAWWPLDPPE